MHHNPIVTMISDFYKSYLSRKSKSTIRGRPIYYNIPPLAEIGGDMHSGTTSTDAPTIKTKPESTV